MSAPVQRRRVGLKCTESTLHGLLSFILWRPSWLGIYIPAPAVVPGLLALPFVGEPGKGWQGGKTPLPPRIPGLSLNLFREVETELSSKPILLQPLRVHICGFPLDYVIIDLPPPTIPASEKGAGLRVIRGTVHAVA